MKEWKAQIQQIKRLQLQIEAQVTFMLLNCMLISFFWNFDLYIITQNTDIPTDKTTAIILLTLSKLVYNKQNDWLYVSDTI